MGIAADSREISVHSTIGGTDKLSVGPDTCKLRRPSPQVMLGVEGLSVIIRRSDQRPVWNALDNANRLFQSSVPLDVAAWLKKAAEWQASFMDQVSAGTVNLETPEADLPQLHVFGLTPTGSAALVSARFSKMGLGIVPYPPYQVENPVPDGYKFIKYGSCNVYLGTNMSRASLTAEQQQRYQRLSLAAGVFGPPEYLMGVAKNFVLLGIDIANSQATDDSPAFVGPPIFTANLAVNSPGWQTGDIGACGSDIPKP